jgi:hypothetical protein
LLPTGATDGEGTSHGWLDFPIARSSDGVTAAAPAVLSIGLSPSTGQYLRDRPAVPVQRPELASGWFGLAGSYPLSGIRAVAECCGHIRLTARPSICSKIIEFVIMVAVMGIMFIDRPDIQLEIKTLREEIMSALEYLMAAFMISAQVFVK